MAGCDIISKRLRLLPLELAEYLALLKPAYDEIDALGPHRTIDFMEFGPSDLTRSTEFEKSGFKVGTACEVTDPVNTVIGADVMDTTESRHLVANICTMPLQTMSSVRHVLAQVLQIRKDGVLWFCPEADSYKFGRTPTIPFGGVREVIPTNCFCIIASAILILAWTRSVKVIVEVKNASHVMKLPCLRIAINTIYGTAKPISVYPGSWGGPSADSFSIYSPAGINWLPLETSKDHAKKHFRPTASLASTYGFSPHTVDFAQVVVYILKEVVPVAVPITSLLGAASVTSSSGTSLSKPVADSLKFIVDKVMEDATSARIVDEIFCAMRVVSHTDERSWAKQLVGRMLLMDESLQRRPSPILDFKFGLDRFVAAEIVESSVGKGRSGVDSHVVDLVDDPY